MNGSNGNLGFKREIFRLEKYNLQFLMSVFLAQLSLNDFVSGICQLSQKQEVLSESPISIANSLQIVSPAIVYE